MNVIGWGAALIAAVPGTRVAVVLDDAAAGTPVKAAIEAALIARGDEVVAPEVSQDLRKVLAPKALLGERLPEGLSVFEADAILAGAAAYGEAGDVAGGPSGVKSKPVALTARLIDLATGHTTATIQATGVGLGVPGPALDARAAKQAVEHLFADGRWSAALEDLGPESGAVTLIVQRLPSRDALLEVKGGLERVLAGAPVREVYFARGLGKLVLGGSRAKAMSGQDVADILGEHGNLGLAVEEVANTRIVAAYHSTIRVHVLVLEPRVRSGVPRVDAEALGKFLATRVATFGWAQATYQPGRLTRKEIEARAIQVAADVIVESEVLGSARSSALAIRVIDARTQRPIAREERIIDAGDFKTAESVLLAIDKEVPERIAGAARPEAGGVRVTGRDPQ